MKTFGDIYKEFVDTVKLENTSVVDYRSCIEVYGFPFIQNAIVCWLDNGNVIIYVSKKTD